MLPTLSARVGYSYLSFSTSVDSSYVEYDAKPKLSNGNLFLDWSPLGPFRITGGLILNDNKVDVTARAHRRHLHAGRGASTRRRRSAA